MEKTAQKRGLLNKLREMTNVSGIAAEKFFNPEFQKVMESLREKDDQIRSLVAGTAIGDGDPGPEPAALKDILKAAKSNLNKREYMLAISDLGKFHKKLSDVAKQISELNLDIDSVHQRFLFGREGEEVLTPDHKENLQYLKQRFASYQERQDRIVKRAGVIQDFLYNLSTRGRALAAWEKRYPKKVGVLKNQTVSMLGQSNMMLERLLSSLKEMASARATRNVDAYMKSAAVFTKLYEKYHTQFENYYRAVVHPLIKDMELISPVKPAPAGSPDLGQQQVPGIPSPSVGPAGTVAGGPPPSGALAPVVPAPKPSVPLTVDDPTLDPNAAPTTQRTGVPPMTPSVPPSPPTLPSPGHTAHRRFVESLESMSGESPLILASLINKYARSIQGSNPEAAIGLFKIAKSIKE